MTTELTLPKPRNDAAAQVAQHIPGIIQALSENVEREAFAHACMVAANESDLSNCKPHTVLMACYNAARMELPPGKQQGLAYFVPFGKDCQLIVGYKGFIELAYRNAFLKSVDVDVVYKGEHWEHWKDEDGSHFKHIPGDDRSMKWEDIERAYCVWRTATGGVGIRVVGKTELIKARNEKSDAWKYFPHAQAAKTAIRRAAALWRLTTQLQAAIALEDAVERGVPQPVMVDGVEVVEHQKTRSGLIDALSDADAADGLSDDEKARIEAEEVARAEREQEQGAY